MRPHPPHATPLILLGLLLGPPAARADDWPVFGRDQTHNAVSPETGAPTDWHVRAAPKKVVGDKVVERHPDDKNIKWTAPLGSRSIGGPVVAGGLVWVGTNNERPRDPRDFRVRKDGKKEPIDKSVLLCFRESDGKFLWQYAVPRIGGGASTFEDWPHSGLGGAPAVVGDRLWLMTNRGEAVCFDIGPLRRGTGEPRELWKVDLRKQLGVVRNVSLMGGGFMASVPAPYQGRVYVVTANGMDESRNVPAPQAASLVCLDQDTGRVHWTDNSPGKDIRGYQISTPLVVEVNGRGQVIVGQGDGWLRSFDALTGRLVWKCDLNPKGTRYELGGGGEWRHAVASPVYAEGRAYITTGWEPEIFHGAAYLYCIDPTKEGDVSLELEAALGKGRPNPNSAVVWRFGGRAQDPAKAGRDEEFSRSMSNCTVRDGLVYTADLAGYVYCLDARSGKPYWTHDTKNCVRGTPLWVDGKVYVADEDGVVWVFAHGKEKQVLSQIDMNAWFHSSPVFANGVLYLMSESMLYALQEKK
jgi:outer membrane protein assembly factor BamB